MFTNFTFNIYGIILLALGWILAMYLLLTRETVTEYYEVPVYVDAPTSKTEKKKVKARDNHSNTVPKYYYFQKTLNELSPEENKTIFQDFNQYLFPTRSQSIGICSGEDMGIKENTRLFLSYDCNGGIVGVMCFLVIDQHDIYGAFSKMGSLNLDLDSVILYNMGVAPEHRRRGIASQLIRESETWARSNGKKKIFLFVNMENIAAIDLYVKSGFVIDGSYYPEANNNEYKMVKLL